MTELWKPTTIDVGDGAPFPGYEEARAYAGLVLIPAYDFDTGIVFGDEWEIFIDRTKQTVLHVLGDEGKALEIATELAALKDWSQFDQSGNIFALALDTDLIQFIARFRRDVFLPMNLDLEDLEHIVPYGGDGDVKGRDAGAHH